MILCSYRRFYDILRGLELLRDRILTHDECTPTHNVEGRGTVLG